MPASRSFEPFQHFLDLWSLIPDGHQIETHSSSLLPVRRDGEALMLKVSHAEEEQTGGRLMAAWRVAPFVHVVELLESGLLMERGATTPRFQDLPEDEAAQEFCNLIGLVHASKAPDGLQPLAPRFEALVTGGRGGFFDDAAAVAKDLLSKREPQLPLHGDMHHENILSVDNRGWRLIDPKGLLGPRGFDFANYFFNPSPSIALSQFEARLELVARYARISTRELLDWIIAWAGLSATWHLADNQDASPTLAIGQKALSLRG